MQSAGQAWSGSSVRRSGAPRKRRKPARRNFRTLISSCTVASEIADTAAILGDARYFMVKNFINNTHFFAWDAEAHASYFRKVKDAVEITVPKLNEMATEQVDLASVPFVTFIANKGKSGEAAAYSFVLRGYVRHWLGNVWAEYDRIHLGDIAAQSTSDLRMQARG